MSEYIEREALLTKIKENALTKFDWSETIDIDELEQVIQDAPTADIAEVRHGKWYRHNKKEHGDTCYYCSVCEKMALSDYMTWELTNYCPNCGAKMGDDEE